MEGDIRRGAEPGQAERNDEKHEALRNERSRIYVASLSDYNNGILHGDWIDAGQELEELQSAVGRMLARSPSDPRAEEFAIHDYEGFGSYRVGEFESLGGVSAVARGIAEHGLAFAAWAALCDTDEDATDRFEEAYLGDYESVTAYAEGLLEGIGLDQLIEDHVPESLQAYVKIDAGSYGNDLILGGDITVAQHRGGVWIFEGIL